MSIKPNILDAVDFVYAVHDKLNADSAEEVKMKLTIYGESQTLEMYEECQKTITECMKLCEERK